jgi:CelD/BcsL family acetyltransferase involved in cellulose biosynthesis
LQKINDFTNPFVENFKTINFSKVYSIDFQGDFNDYKENIKKKDKNHAYEIHRTLIKYEKLKKISKNIGVEIKDSLYDTSDIDNIIKEKKDQLYKKNIPNKLGSQFKKIFKNLIKSKKINFYLISLMVNNQAISKCFGFVYLNTYYYYIPTILPNSFSNYKPGKILIVEIIQWCIKNNIKKFDFGLGSEKYKKHFSNKETNLHRYINFYTLKGSIVFISILLILKIKKLWL